MFTALSNLFVKIGIDKGFVGIILSGGALIPTVLTFSVWFTERRGIKNVVLIDW